MQAPRGTTFSPWLFYEGMDSLAAAQKAIETSGGALARGPHELPGGAFIIIASDPQEAIFGVVGPKGK